MKKYRRILIAAGGILASCFIQLSSADSSGDAGGSSATELAKATQNPIAKLISVPFQNNTNFNVGPDDKTQNILNIQPVVPFSLNEDWNLITRTILPVISQPGFAPGDGRTNGIGDVQFSTFFSPKAPTASGWIWGAGTIVELDTASDDRLGTGKWSLGPTAVALKMTGHWVIGTLINNLWDVAGSDTNADVNKMLIQPFINYNFPDKPGRYLTTAPIITANWEAGSGDKWTLPIGGGIGQVIPGKTPINIQASAYYNTEKPKYGADWQLRLQVQLLFPK